MLIVKIILIAVVCSIFSVLIRQLRPEFAPLVQVASVLILLTVALSSARAVIEKLSTLSQSADSFITESAFALFKVLAIVFATKIASDMCKDSGNSTIAVCVDFIGKVIVILMCFPLVETIFELSLRFVE